MTDQETAIWLADRADIHAGRTGRNAWVKACVEILARVREEGRQEVLGTIRELLVRKVGPDWPEQLGITPP
jgi:hypothetical protein